jgi:catechol 2,3-dioxygenase
MLAPIHPNTAIGAVTLIVANLQRSLNYYQHHIGLRLHQQDDGAATLGAGEATLLRLVEQPGARPVQSGCTGLYHFALLTPSRLELARTLRRLLDTNTPIGGASDHAVSEALYLSDPDGHGIEIYRDRPRHEWQFPGGQLHMTVEPFDAQGVLAELRDETSAWDGIHPETTMGHIHLHVAHIPAAEHFYVEVLGFELMARYGQAAAFIAAGGYHHHIGLNTWAGVGAPPPPADAARLHHFEIHLPDKTALGEVASRLQAADIPIQEQEGGWFVRDPAQNGILVKSEA